MNFEAICVLPSKDEVLKYKVYSFEVGRTCVTTIYVTLVMTLLMRESKPLL